MVLKEEIKNLYCVLYSVWDLYLFVWYTYTQYCHSPYCHNPYCHNPYHHTYVLPQSILPLICTGCNTYPHNIHTGTQSILPTIYTGTQYILAYNTYWYSIHTGTQHILAYNPYCLQYILTYNPYCLQYILVHNPYRHMYQHNRYPSPTLPSFSPDELSLLVFIPHSVVN